MTAMNVSPEMLKKVFAEKKITPDIIEAAPKKLLTVNFKF